MVVKDIPLKQAIRWIIFSVFIVSGSAAMFFSYYQYIKWRQKQDETYRIVAIIQTTPNPETLKTSYLAELFNLSYDQPTNLYAFSAKDAQKKLLLNPIVKWAKVKKIRPGTIHVDYEMREPVAFLSDLNNTAIDSTATPFPMAPFFTPKKLPEIYLGNYSSDGEKAAIEWGKEIQSKKMQMALGLLNLLNEKIGKEELTIKRIDVSKTDAPSLGRRQAVVILEEKKSVYTLRLNAEKTEEGVEKFLVLRRNCQNFENEGNFVIDLRLEQLACVKK